MKKKLLVVFTTIFVVFSLTGCSIGEKTNKTNLPTSNINTDNNEGIKPDPTKKEVKKEDDKIIQEAIDTMDNVKLEDIDDSILNDTELDSILNDKNDPISDIPTK